MKMKILSIAALSALTMMSCKKSNNAAPSIAYQLKVSNASSIINGRELGGTITWTSGVANVDEIKFRAKSDTSKIEYRNKSVQKVDLFASVTSLANLNVPQGVYKEVKFDIELLGGTDNAFELKGTYNLTPVVFRISDAFEIEGKVTGVTLSSNSSFASLTTVNLAKISQGITGAQLDAATRDANGVIVISSTSNTSLYQAMLSNLQICEEQDFK